MAFFPAAGRRSSHPRFSAPGATGDLGIIYSQDGIYGSLLGNWIGNRNGDVGQTQRLSPFYTIDAALGCKLDRLDEAFANASINLQVNTITDVTKIVISQGYTYDQGTPLTGHSPAAASSPRFRRL